MIRTYFKLIREPDDPLALRASIGGTEDIGWYLVYRGDPARVLAMLREVVAGAERELPKAMRPQGMMEDVKVLSWPCGDRAYGKGRLFPWRARLRRFRWHWQHRHQGGVCFPPGDWWRLGKVAPYGPRRGEDRLSHREREILALRRAEWSHEQIARKLGVTTGRIRHVEHGARRALDPGRR